MYKMSPYVIALPQVVLNVGVIAIILLSLLMRNEVKFKESENFLMMTYFKKPTPNILFLLNLSFTDLVQAVLLFIVVRYINFNEYDSSDPEAFAEEATNGCHNKSTIICFLYTQSMIATILLTLDRYVTISYPLNHKVQCL